MSRWTAASDGRLLATVRACRQYSRVRRARHLVLAIEATDPANLARMQQIVGGLIERFASREGLQVEWVQERTLRRTVRP